MSNGNILDKKTLFWASVCVIIGTSYVGAYAFEPEDHVETEPKRITVERIDQYPLVGDSFIASLSPINFYRVIRSDRPIFHEDLPSGNYDAVIDAAHEVIKKHSTWWEEEEFRPIDDGSPFDPTDDPLATSEYQALLAIAYELKGEWRLARMAYELAYGQNSEEARWAKIRMLYSRGSTITKLEALREVVFLMDKTYLGSVDAVNERIRTHYENPENANSKYASAWLQGFYETDKEAFYLWKFRNNCARVICPELYFVSSKYKQIHGGRNFYELQQESFEKFVEYVEEIWDIDECDKEADFRRLVAGGDSRILERLELIRKLKTMPYRFEQK